MGEPMLQAGGLVEEARSRGVMLVGAATSLGIRPYDGRDEARRLDEAPSVLRGLGVAERLAARDLGDVRAEAYVDFVRPAGGIRNEAGVERYSRVLAERLGEAVGGGGFALVLGGDCSVVLAALLAAKRAVGRVGLAYLDAHADFGTPADSLSGSVASMCLALAVGRGDGPLVRLGGEPPLARPEDVALIGRRDEDQPNYGHGSLAASGVLDLPGRALAARGSERIVAAALERIARPEVPGFWIHLDADLLDPRLMPAVDSPEPGGPTFEETAALLLPLVRHPKALGMNVTIYDPSLDPDRSAGERLVWLLERVLSERSEESDR